MKEKSIILPLGSKILIEPVDEAIKKGGKAFMPETESKEERKKSSQGKVIAVGSEYQGELKRGDRIYYDRFAGEYFIIEDKEFYAVRAEDVFVVLR